MSKFDDSDEMLKFSWVGLLSVTGFCCFLFSFFMKLIDETNIFPFIKIGAVSMALASVLYMYSYIKSKNAKKARQKVQAGFPED